MNFKHVIIILSCLLMFTCQKEQAVLKQNDKKEGGFNLVKGIDSGIKFNNRVDEFGETNYFNYFQLYQGAGVAAGDFNNDGLTDIFFQRSSGGGVLYKNNGNLKFEEIRLPAKLFNLKGVGNGVSLVDVNQDGLLDIYLCYAGRSNLAPEFKTNKLLINKGDFSFTESAALYGLDNKENSVQASFFDFDKDGDLDVYLVNTNTNRDFAERIITKKDLKFDNPHLAPLGAQDRFYENKGNGKFVDITTSCGLMPELFFGFNASIGDYNNDNWPDVFVSNDFYNPDFLYINNKNGTFTEACYDYFKHTSYNSMGSDAGDFNNDGLDDLAAVDMSPEDYKRSRKTMGMTDTRFFNRIRENGYGVQYMHNVLQLNTGKNSFREISHYSGIDKTDWSWAVLQDDFDNDGYKDLYVTNGIFRDINDNDARIQRTALINSKNNKVSPEEFKEIVNSIPSVPLKNYLFINQGNLKYERSSEHEQGTIPGFSQGAATADFDNDGDLDIIVNNTNQEAFLLENNAPTKNFIQFKFEGPKENQFGAGAKVCIHVGETKQCNKMYVSRGYMSSVDYRLHFGIGDNQEIDFVSVTWPDGKYERTTQVKLNTLNNMSYSSAKNKNHIVEEKTALFKEADNVVFKGHLENSYDDFSDQLLLPHKLSELGPGLAMGDVNGDGHEDVYIGGGKDNSGNLYLQDKTGNFKISNQKSFLTDKEYEDTDALFFDFNQDGHLDLFVTSGSYEYEDDALELLDRLYVNDSKGNFSRYEYGKELRSNSMTIACADVDNDNDLDLFIGGRVLKGKYPFSPSSHLLINEGKGLVDKTVDLAKDLKEIGMVTDAEFVDFDEDGDMDLVVVGEWLPVSFFENENGLFTKKILPSEAITTGWWNTIEVVDLNADGKKDLVLGNLGLNYKFSASPKKPLKIYCNDFDDNGTFDIVLAKPISNTLYPVRGKMCSSEQMPFIEKKYPTFTAYADAGVEDIYGDKLEESLQMEATKFENCMFINKGNWNFEIKDLPQAAQLSPIKDIVAKDFNSDGNVDLLLAGNLFGAEVETTRADSGIGLLLLGNGMNDFEAVDCLDSGFFVDKKIRKMGFIPGKKEGILVVNNNDLVNVFYLNN